MNSSLLAPGSTISRRSTTLSVARSHRNVALDGQAGNNLLDESFDGGHLSLVHDQRSHGAQQVMMVKRRQRCAGQRHSLQPAKYAQHGVRITQAIEHHDTNQGFNVNAVAGVAALLNPGSPGVAHDYV